jgi:hypothetical protein
MQGSILVFIVKLSAGSIPSSASPRKAKAALDYLPLGSKSFRQPVLGNFS